MADGAVKYDELRREFQELIRNACESDDDRQLLNSFSKARGSDGEKKNAADQSFRDLVKESLLSDEDVETQKHLITLAIKAAAHGTCSTTLPVILLSDVFDTITLDRCDSLFTFVEEQVSTWTMPIFFSSGKNLLLRMCNDLLRRLSASQNTVFCGRIQLFLARLFPLSEKSGLNLMSQFNLDNVTTYATTTEEEDSVNDMETGDGTEAGELVQSNLTPVDYNLYRKFWALQDYFRNPTQCYTTVGWKTFSKYSQEVLGVFASHKLEHISSSIKTKGRKDRQEDASGRKDEPCYFAKFLTNEKLLDLQLSDSNFRRTILVQFLIVFQYLVGNIKFKSSSQVLSELQSLWVKETTSQVYQLIKETPPDGESFANTVEHILEREENWISWKNEGCLSFIKEKEKEAHDVVKGPKAPKRKRTKSIGEEINAEWQSKKLQMGSSELTRLWNLCSDNLEACSAEKRVFLPSLEEFFEEAIEQADPDGMVEDEYKLIKKSNFGWRALRLLARRSQHFFQPSSNPFKPLPDYLESVVSQLAQELPTLKQEENVVENGSSESSAPI
ncbi:THO complex subunit 1 [Nematostella vectensis]|uniref:THO complex subunit 1 n=1 Tax=Nematostella vectensis TaxID=45351 RepID=UPI002076ED32|nr:THO complex subunit 1 [Nematostella vectensis]